MEDFGINRGGNGQEDRLSALPDELIHRILSFGVGLNEVVQTCVLSKRWVNLWSAFPFLNLTPPPVSPFFKDDIYCKFITMFLLNRNRHSENCSVSIDFNPFDEYIRGMLLLILFHAVSHSVRKLHISNAEHDSYLSFPVLRELTLNQCHVSLTRWSLPCLTTLHLETLFTFGDELSFKEFRCLKNLSMEEITGEFMRMDPEVVRIDPPNLENLTIFQGNTTPPNCVFVVSAPKLKCFRFYGRYTPVFSAENGFPCLEVVEYGIDVNQDKGNFEYDNYMYTYEAYNLEDENQVNEIMLKISNLFRVFCKTKVLTLHLETFQVLSRVQDFSKYQPSPFVNLKSLYLIDYAPRGPPLLGYECPPCSKNHVINYLLSNSPGAEIIMLMSKEDDNTSEADCDTSD